MKKKYNIVFFILGLAIFVYLILNFGINNIVSNIYKTGFYILPIIGVWLVIYLLNTLTWYLIIKDDFPDIKYFNLLKIHLSSSALNYITPFINLGGEPYRIMCTREFIGEGVLYFDVVRWRTASTNDPIFGLNRDVLDFRGIKLFSKVFTERDYLWPIPVQEIEINTKLSQNPGWE